MRNSSLFTALPLLAALGGGCAGAMQEERGATDRQVRFAIHSPAELSIRTAMSGSTASFLSGDQIGISETLTGRRNVQYAYNGSSWSTTTPMYWYNGLSTHTFYAYYPYNAAALDNRVTLPLLSAQQVSTTPDPACDMLVAGPKAQARTAGTSVPLTFSHAFSLLQFNVTMGLLNTHTLKTVTVQGGNTDGASGYGIVNRVNTVGSIGYNLTTGTVQATPNDGTVYAQTFTQSVPSVGLIGTIPVTFYVIVLPGLYNNPALAVQFTVAPLIGSNQTTALANLSVNQPQPNTKYVYNVKIGGLLTRSAARQRPGLRNEPGLRCDLVSVERFP